MNETFTTTFVPKKPITPVTSSSGKAPVSRPVGFLSTISAILFFITIALGAGVYFWKQYQQTRVAQLAESVATIEKTFEPQLITELQSLDRQLKNANILLSGHTVASPIFGILETSTLPQVRFTRFDMTQEESKEVKVTMSGEADSYTFIAQQADILSKNTFIRNMIFSNFVLNQRGKITFDVTFGVRPEFVDFGRAPLGTTSASSESSL